MTPSKEKTALNEALEDHRRLLDLQGRLARRFAEFLPCAFDAWIDEVRSEIGEMISMLEAHFIHEEQDRLHDEIADALPNATYRLGKLLEQHGEIVECGRRLRSRAMACYGATEGPALAAEASEFFALLDAHERAERELFLLALEGEGGAPD